MRERLLRESELTLPKAIAVSHAAEETRKHAHEILKSNETIHQHKISKHSNSRSQTSTQGTEIIKTASFAKILTTVVNVKFNRKNHVKKCCPRNRKTLHNTEQTETESLSADKYDFFLDATNLNKARENLVNISQVRNELSEWNITLPSNGIPVSYNMDTGAQCNVIAVKNLENMSPRPDLQPVNIKLSTYNGSKIPVVGKCLLTIDHKNNSFKVSFIFVDLDSVPVLGLKTNQYLQLIKIICRIETNSEMFFSEFYDCFGEIGTSEKYVQLIILK